MVFESVTTSRDIGVTLVNNPSSISSPKCPHIVSPLKLSIPLNTDDEGVGVTLGDSIDDIVHPTSEATIESSGLHGFPIHSNPESIATTESTTKSILLITPISVVEPIQQVPLTTLTLTTNISLSTDSLVTMVVLPISKILLVMSFLKKGASKRAFQDKLFGICTLVSTTTAMTPLIVTKPTSGASIVSASDTIDVDALIYPTDNSPLDTASDNMLVTSSTPSGSTIPELAPLPTLMSLASSLPYFLHHFTSTRFTNNPGLCKARASVATTKSMEFDKLLECMDNLRSSYQVLEREKT
ncbi:unnamed protein product [Lactuca virosa]|uniref:Uncharacterized protein n=1 Tax=Lactuca virosa TaxID=75947 RepID=A0AAU9LQP6_9ASTR|nr:unnamed protein product [Lactuca virosa]